MAGPRVWAVDALVVALTSVAIVGEECVSLRTSTEEAVALTLPIRIGEVSNKTGRTNLNSVIKEEIIRWQAARALSWLEVLLDKMASNVV